jgi:hypothetical protein
MIALRAFMLAHPADAFYFYEPTETSPLYSYDPTGEATDGRYLVRFASDWSQSMGIRRGETGVDLVEVASSAGAIDIVDPTEPPPPLPFPVESAVLSFTTEYLAPGPGLYQVAAICANTDRFWGNLSSHVPAIPLNVPYSKTTFTVDLMTLTTPMRWFDPGWFMVFDIIAQTGSTQPAEFRVYEVSITVTRSDGSTQVFLPTVAEIVGKSGLGTQLTGTPPTIDPSDYVDDPANAIDGDPLTYAAIHRDRLAGVTPDYPNLLIGGFV